MRVVLVDDDETIRTSLRRFLEMAAVDVIGEAADGEAGVSLVRELLPDAVIMDLRMPTMTGTEAARILRDTAPGVAVIMMSAFDDAALQLVARNAGVYRYLVKGSGARAVLEVLRELEAVALDQDGVGA